MSVRTASWVGPALVALLASTAEAGPPTPTREVPYGCLATSGDCPARIPDAGGDVAGVTLAEVIVPAGACIEPTPNESIQVEVTVDARHSWVGDLRITLVSPIAQRFELLRRPGNEAGATDGSCAGDDLALRFRDGSLPDLACGTGIPALAGEAASFTALFPLAGPILNGAWTLEVADEAPGSDGFLVDWAVVFSCALAEELFADGFEAR